VRRWSQCGKKIANADAGISEKRPRLLHTRPFQQSGPFHLYTDTGLDPRI